jgi:hypothetical protein
MFDIESQRRLEEWRAAQGGTVCWPTNCASHAGHRGGAGRHGVHAAASSRSAIEALQEQQRSFAAAQQQALLTGQVYRTVMLPLLDDMAAVLLRRQGDDYAIVDSVTAACSRLASVLAAHGLGACRTVLLEALRSRAERGHVPGDVAAACAARLMCSLEAKAVAPVAQTESAPPSDITTPFVVAPVARAPCPAIGRSPPPPPPLPPTEEVHCCKALQARHDATAAAAVAQESSRSISMDDAGSAAAAATAAAEGAVRLHRTLFPPACSVLPSLSRHDSSSSRTYVACAGHAQLQQGSTSRSVPVGPGDIALPYAARVPGAGTALAASPSPSTRLWLPASGTSQGVPLPKRQRQQHQHQQAGEGEMKEEEEKGDAAETFALAGASRPSHSAVSTPSHPPSTQLAHSPALALSLSGLPAARCAPEMALDASGCGCLGAAGGAQAPGRVGTVPARTVPLPVPVPVPAIDDPAGGKRAPAPMVLPCKAVAGAASEVATQSTCVGVAGNRVGMAAGSLAAPAQAGATAALFVPPPAAADAGMGEHCIAGLPPAAVDLGGGRGGCRDFSGLQVGRLGASTAGRYLPGVTDCQALLPASLSAQPLAPAPVSRAEWLPGVHTPLGNSLDGPCCQPRPQPGYSSALIDALQSVSLAPSVEAAARADDAGARPHGASMRPVMGDAAAVWAVTLAAVCSATLSVVLNTQWLHDLGKAYALVAGAIAVVLAIGLLHVNRLWRPWQ